MEKNNSCQKLCSRIARLRRRAYMISRRPILIERLPLLQMRIEHLERQRKSELLAKEFRLARARRKVLLHSKRARNHLQQPGTSSSGVIQRARGRLTSIAGSSGLVHPRRGRGRSTAVEGPVQIINEPWNFGRPTSFCSHCNAKHWYEERVQKSKKTTHPEFYTCCLKGRVKLPLLQEAPALLKSLLDYRGGRQSSKFRTAIRMYNCSFNFTSMGGDVKTNINNRGGSYNFRLSGQNYHRLGSLLPPDGSKPCFAQLYVHDTEQEIQNRLNILPGNHLDQNLVRDLLNMLDEHNVLVQSFRMARDIFRNNEVTDLKLRLIANRATDGRQNNLPTASEVAALIIGNRGNEETQRDIIIQHKTEGFQRITELHPSFMALQYPLLFPYGEDGFRLKIPHVNPGTGKSYKKNSVTLRQYYSFRIQQRQNEGQTLLRAGRLLQQYLVDAYACVEENRLNWARNNQTQLGAELYKGLKDAIKQTDVLGDDVGKMTLVPSTHTGGPRYRVQNYQDAMAICRTIGYPDLFVTFTCNSKWPEIEYFIEELDGQKADDRIDIVCRVFSIKLWELLHDIKRRHIFGKTIGGN